MMLFQTPSSWLYLSVLVATCAEMSNAVHWAVWSCADVSFMRDFLDTKVVALLDTARMDCYGFDIRAVFRTKRRAIMLFIRVEHDVSGPSVPHGGTKPMQQYVKHTAFHPAAEEARKTAYKAANKLGAAAVFLTLSTGNPADVAPIIDERADCGQHLIFLMADGLKSWLPLLSSRPDTICSQPEESP